MQLRQFARDPAGAHVPDDPDADRRDRRRSGPLEIARGVRRRLCQSQTAVRKIAPIVGLATLIHSASFAQTTPKLERMPESLETRFALSAAPPPARAQATVQVLDPSKGY